MYEVLQSYISWWQFILLALFLGVIFYLLRRFKRQVFKYTSLKTLHYPNLILLVLLVILFVLVRPFINGFVVIVLLALCYPIISSYIKGMAAFNNMKLKTGDLIKINNQEGRISEVSFSGVKLHTGSNNVFIPFGQLADQIVERYTSDQIQYLSLICHLEEKTDKLNKNIVEKLVFNFPFLEHKSKIDIQQIENSVRVNVSLADNRFRSSLLEKFADEGINVELTKNN